MDIDIAIGKTALSDLDGMYTLMSDDECDTLNLRFQERRRSVLLLTRVLAQALLICDRGRREFSLCHIPCSTDSYSTLRRLTALVRCCIIAA